jgi:hypothetical protein
MFCSCKFRYLTYLPADNPNIPKRLVTSRHKNSITETCDGTSFSDTNHKDDENNDQVIVSQSINNNVVKDISSDKASETSDNTSDNTSNRQIKSDLRECSQCEKLYSENLELARQNDQLKEALLGKASIQNAHQVSQSELEFMIHKARYEELRHAMHESQNLIYLIFDKSRTFMRARPDVFNK